MILNQRNPLWANVRIGQSHLTIGGYGCTLTGMAEINNDFGQNCTPDQVAAKPWFNAAGEIIWPLVELKSAIWTWRQYGYDAKKVKASILDPDQRVLVRVSLAHGFHWLKATRIDWLGRIWADDPWTGLNIDVVKHYGAINGSSHFKRRVPPLK